MSTLLTLVALLGATASAGTGDDDTTLGIRVSDEVDPSAHEQQERGRPAARSPMASRPASRPAASRPMASRSTASRPSPVRAPVNRPSSARTQPSSGQRPMMGQPTTRPCPPGACTTTGTRPGGTTTRPGEATTTRPGGATGPGGVTRPSGTTTRPGTVGPGGVTRPGVGRPGGVVTRPGVGRPGGVVVRPGVGRPGGVVVARPGVVVRPVRTVRYAAVYPYHGVFVYGPRPVTHVTYVQSGPRPVQVQRRDLPKRELDRTNSLAIGAGVGQIVSSTASGIYADPGLQLVGRYRPNEAVGLELGLGHYNGGGFSSIEQRSQTNVNAQAKLYAFPWAKVSPYALVGGMYNVTNVQSEILAGDTSSGTYTNGAFGLDGGLGLELALGRTLALDFEGKYVGWMGRGEADPAGAFLANAGLVVHFR